MEYKEKLPLKHLGNILWNLRPRSVKTRLRWLHLLCGYEIKHT